MTIGALFGPLSPAHVSDALKELRLGGGVVSGWRGRGRGSFAGVALPVQCLWEPFRTVEPAQYRTAEIQAAVGPSSVVIIDGGGRDAAVFGPVAAAAYAASGASAVVVNGGSRGCTEIAESGLSVLTRHEVHQSGYGSVRRELVDRVILDGTEIRRGDVIVGDQSGIVVVPADAAVTVAHRAVAIAAADEEIIAGLNNGQPFVDLWGRSPRNTT